MRERDEGNQKRATRTPKPSPAIPLRSQTSARWVPLGCWLWTDGLSAVNRRPTVPPVYSGGLCGSELGSSQFGGVQGGRRNPSTGRFFESVIDLSVGSRGGEVRRRFTAQEPPWLRNDKRGSIIREPRYSSVVVKEEVAYGQPL